MTKTLLDLAEDYLALILMGGYSYWLCKAKTNKAVFDVTREDEISYWANILDNTFIGQPGWSTEVTET